MPPALTPVIDEVLTGRPPSSTARSPSSSPCGGAGRCTCARRRDGALAVLVDVTAAGDFREARRLFSAAVSHELRTPLARILGLAETLGLPQTDAERETLVAQIEIEVDAMRGLIDEMLLLAALDRGEIRQPATRPTPAPPPRRWWPTAARAARGASRDLRFVATRASASPVAPRLLEVVLGNLLDNALLHAGDGARSCPSTCDALGPATSRSPSATPASASRPSTCRTCSSASTAPRRRAPARAPASASRS